MTIKNEFKGYWYLPDNPNNKVTGILYYHQNEEIRLELIGCFETDIADSLSFKSVNVIHGITHKNEKISLFNCRASGSWNLSSDYTITKYSCGFLIIGKHFLSINEEIFNSIEIDVTHLYNWRPSGMIRQSVSFSADSKPVATEFSLSNSDYWEDVFEIDGNFNFKIFGISKAKGSFDGRETKLTQNTLCTITNTKTKSSLTSLLELAGVFRQFLTLASLTSVEYLVIKLFDDNDFQESEHGKRFFPPVSLYFIDKPNYTVRNERANFLFTYSDIMDFFPEIIKKWYSIKSDLAPIRNHLIESVKPKQIFTSLDFLIIVQALEGYHRRFIAEKRIILRTRIEGLINLFSDVKKINTNPINVTHVVRSRDYYSHFYEDKTDVLEGVELYGLTNQLRILLICCVLRLIGFDNTLIDKLLNQNTILQM